MDRFILEKCHLKLIPRVSKGSCPPQFSVQRSILSDRGWCIEVCWPSCQSRGFGVCISPASRALARGRTQPAAPVKWSTALCLALRNQPVVWLSAWFTNRGQSSRGKSHGCSSPLLAYGSTSPISLDLILSIHCLYQSARLTVVNPSVFTTSHGPLHTLPASVSSFPYQSTRYSTTLDILARI